MFIIFLAKTIAFVVVRRIDEGGFEMVPPSVMSISLCKAKLDCYFAAVLIKKF